MRRSLLLANVLAIALVATMLPVRADHVPPPVEYGESRNFRVIGHTDLDRRGGNSPLAIADHCAYVGDRATGGTQRGIAIVDISDVLDGPDPDDPLALADLPEVNTIPPISGGTSRELRTVESLDLLVVMYHSGSIGGPQNLLETYDVSDCANPTLLGTHDFNRRSPHEFFLWVDPEREGRVIAFVAMPLTGGVNLEVVDLSDPTSPRLLTVYDAGKIIVNEQGQLGNYLHSLSVTDDGRRAWLAYWDAGLFVVDTSQIADDLPVPLILPVPGAEELDYSPPDAGRTHSAVLVPDRDLILVPDEIYISSAPGCPYGWLRVVDVRDERYPTQIGEHRLFENYEENCPIAVGEKNGTFTAHNPTTTTNLAFVPWYGGGVRAVDITEADRPIEVGFFVPPDLGLYPRRDSRLGSWGVAMWSYPTIKDGLIYVVDINSGLWVLKYDGPLADEAWGYAFLEGASNQRSSRQPIEPWPEPEEES